VITNLKQYLLIFLHVLSQTEAREPNTAASETHVQEATRLCEEVKLPETTWQQRELTLGQTIQHLAEENM
jgi:hypothetical protein